MVKPKFKMPSAGEVIAFLVLAGITIYVFGFLIHPSGVTHG